VIRGAKVALVFTRRTNQTCAAEVAIPTLKLKKPLPLNTPVTIEYMADKTGEVAFTCGMDMIRGTWWCSRSVQRKHYTSRQSGRLS
jgi:plastocyanin domain-containing protein